MDLTLKDMELLKHDIYYPPTPAMRNIKNVGSFIASRLF